jgi:diadenosine tetraphosphate (Ap4A) HIT family hydrolase
MPAEKTCPLCDVGEDRIIVAHQHAIAVADLFPIATGHTLVIPRRHVTRIFDLDRSEYTELWNFVFDVRRVVAERFRPAAFNIGVNDGKAAGQTIEHAHIHIIPRYDRDVDDPRGGIRWILPQKAKYWE